MIKKIAICAILALVLVPAFAMAAGPQDHGAGNAKATARQAMQGTEQGQSIGAGQMMQNGTCTQNCEMARIMIRNQSQLGAGSAGGAAALSIDAARQQQRLGTQDGTRTMDRIMNRTHLRDGSCGNCTRL